MSILQGILYGILQGITEFLPVSSSGHLSLMQNLFGAQNLEENYFAFTVFLHLGTLAAVIAVYYKDVWLMIKGFFTLVAKLFGGRLRQGLEPGEKLFVLVAVATLPLIAVVPFSDKVSALSSISWLIGVLLILNGVMLYLADRFAGGSRTLEGSRPRNAFFVGLVQLFGIMPGISRSGSTITGGLFAGYGKADAVRLSFLMSIPAIAGANILELFKLREHPLPAGSLPAVLCGVAAAVISGLAAIKLLKYIAANKRLSVFSLYCVIIGCAAITADIFI